MSGNCQGADIGCISTLDWNLWLGPAPLRRFNANRWGVHVLDIVHLAFGEPMPSAITTLGGKYWITDNCETPDTLVVTWEYPQGFLVLLR